MIAVEWYDIGAEALLEATQYDEKNNSVPTVQSRKRLPPVLSDLDVLELGHRTASHHGRCGIDAVFLPCVLLMRVSVNGRVGGVAKLRSRKVTRKSWERPARLCATSNKCVCVCVCVYVCVYSIGGLYLIDPSIPF